MGLCVAEREQRGLYFMPALGRFWKNTACACLGFSHILSEAFVFNKDPQHGRLDRPQEMSLVPIDT